MSPLTAARSKVATGALLRLRPTTSMLTCLPPRLRQAYLSLTPGLVSSHRKILVIRSGCQALLTGFGSLRSDTGGGGERELGVQGGTLPGRAEEGDPAA